MSRPSSVVPIFQNFARVGELAEHVAVLVERLDRGFVRDREQDDVAPFFRRADLPVLGASGSRLRERFVVAIDVLGVGQLAGCADRASEELQRRRHRIGRRQVIHELGRDARILQVLLDRLGVFLVDLLRLFRRGFLRLETGAEDKGM